MERKTLLQYLSKKGYHLPKDQTYNHIDEWLSWYQNDVEKFHKYKIYNGVNISEEERYRLGMAKTVCEDWANLIMNEKVQIHTKKKELDKVIESAFTRNNFRVRANQLIEIAFALGTGAFVAYKAADELCEIDYIRADMIFPLSWANGEIVECAFGSERKINGEDCVYIQIHRYGTEGEQSGVYYIENRIIAEEDGKEMELPPEMIPLVNTGRTEPFFFIITPNVYNNIELESPLGISIFANAMYAIKGTDLVYDSYMNEFVLGRKRVMVGMRAVKRMMAEDGVQVPVFDLNDKVFMAYSDNSLDESTPVKELDMHIRAEEHEKALQRCLDALSLKCGMGSGRYKFENGSAQTATAVISANSDLYRNLKKHELIIDSAVKGLVRAILFIENGNDNTEIVIEFDDSVIEDVEKQRQTDRADVSMGALQLYEYRMKWYGEDESTAKAAVQQPAEVIE